MWSSKEHGKFQTSFKPLRLIRVHFSVLSCSVNNGTTFALSRGCSHHELYYRASEIFHPYIIKYDL